jgi:hypothetical protein
LNVDVHFDPTRLRIDPILCINVLMFFHLNSQCHELEETFDWVKSVLEYCTYLDGTRYYKTGKAFQVVQCRETVKPKSVTAMATVIMVTTGKSVLPSCT